MPGIFGEDARLDAVGRIGAAVEVLREQLLALGMGEEVLRAASSNCSGVIAPLLSHQTSFSVVCVADDELVLGRAAGMDAGLGDQRAARGRAAPRRGARAARRARPPRGSSRRRLRLRKPKASAPCARCRRRSVAIQSPCLDVAVACAAASSMRPHETANIGAIMTHRQISAADRATSPSRQTASALPVSQADGVNRR